MSDLLTALTMLGSAIVAALLALLIGRWMADRTNRRTPRLIWGAFDAPRIYEFRDGYLLTDLGEEDVFLNNAGDRAGAWAALSDTLSRINPRIPQEMEALRRSGKGFLVMAESGADTLSISGNPDGDLVVITVANATMRDGKIVVEAESFRRQRAEAEALRRASEHTPVVSWREGEDGQITWANGAYLRTLELISDADQDIGWPLRSLFGDQIPEAPPKGAIRRVSVEVPDRPTPTWFEVSATAFGSETLYLAMPADRLVQAEEALKEFIQTLSKTFADLPIGLAVFDRRRELVLFNPALVTLSTLDAMFLSSRPTLFNFLDQLRESRHMPEPKDYRAWRESINKLEADAVDGTFHDLWTLPMGQTYRVIGRPHPDGAIAFMFEDITSEVSLTRQFRADLDLYQAVIDQRGEAMAVFSAEAQLVLSNSAYAELWGHDPREILGSLSLREAVEKWEQEMVPGPIWRQIRDFAVQRPGRTGWTGQQTIPGRGTLDIRVVPLKAGSTLLTFRMDTDTGTAPAQPTAATAELPAE